MDCRRAEELLSDHREGSLDEILRSELERHLAGCEACRDLRAALEEVVDALRSYPSVDPPAGLSERVAAAALARGRATAPPASAFPVSGAQRWLQAAAAILLLAGGTYLLLAGPDSGPARSAERAIEQTMNAAAFATERKDRLVEELRLWRVLIAAAFEGRLDRVSDRFADYRRRLERRRTAEPQKQSGAGEAPLSETLSNSAEAGLVTRFGDG